jgi:NTE family protein
MSEPHATAPSEPAGGRYLPPPASARQGLALCLSGGGFRAALFHLGALRRLDELGVLPRITTISSVSGGSIVSALLATRLDPWPTAARDPRFERLARDVRALTARNIRFVPSYRLVERAYKGTFGSGALNELPSGGPSHVFCATDMANGVNWTFARDHLDRAQPGRWEAGSYRAGYTPAGQLALSRAVAASSAFPPVLGPVSLPIAESEYAAARGGTAKSVRLTDGGVYDNLGLEPVWKTHRTILVSDGGATIDIAPYSPWKPWKRFGRYLGLASSQGTQIRKRWLISNYRSNRSDKHYYEGAYFGIGSELSAYRQASLEVYPDDLITDVNSEVRTDLDVFSDAEAAVLQNHGYLACDAGVRTWCPRLVEADAPPPAAPFRAWLKPERVRKALARSHKRRWPFGSLR